MRRDVTIIVSHFESLPFLRACVRKIRQYEHPEIGQHIIIAEQSSELTRQQVISEFDGQDDITVVKVQPLYSGFSVDYIMRYMDIKTEYVCQLHVDAFPIHKNWLRLCIDLIESGFAFVGQLHFYSRPNDPIYYLKNMFFSMSPTFNVAKTETYKEMALEAGFTRYHERPKIDPPMTFGNDDWNKWAAEDYHKRGSDDDTIAFCWEDNHREHDKLGLATTAVIGVPPEPGYGRVIEDIVFHFGFSCESKGVMDHMGKSYRDWTAKINDGFSDELIDSMLAAARPTGAFTRTVWDGKQKTVADPTEELNKKIDDGKCK